jgi:hypothetical protein
LPRHFELNIGGLAWRQQPRARVPRSTLGQTLVLQTLGLQTLGLQTLGLQTLGLQTLGLHETLEAAVSRPAPRVSRRQ